jgi:NTP pyrophosphatase (non-canonical NTP hydrolase)
VTKNIYASVIAERARQDAEYGRPAKRGYTPEYWLAVLMEEVGEVAQDVQLGQRELMVAELIQVAAVAMAFAEAMQE